LTTKASGGAGTGAILTRIRAYPDPPTRAERRGKKYWNTLLNRATAAPMRPPGKDSGFAKLPEPELFYAPADPTGACSPRRLP